MTASTAKRWWAYLLQVIYLFGFSLIFVPISVRAEASWAHLARDSGIRLLVVLALAAITSLMLPGNSAEAYRIVPSPEPVPESAPQPDLALEVEPVVIQGSSRKLPLTFRIVLAAGADTFLIGLYSEVAKLRSLTFTPGGVMSVAGACLTACSWAVLSMCGSLLVVGVITERKPPVVLPRRRRIRRRVVQVAVCALIVTVVWLLNTPWWERLGGSVCLVFCWACFIVLWMPKSTAQPELLQIVPRMPHETDAG